MNPGDIFHIEDITIYIYIGINTTTHTNACSTFWHIKCNEKIWQSRPNGVPCTSYHVSPKLEISAGALSQLEQSDVSMVYVPRKESYDNALHKKNVMLLDYSR